MEAKDQNTNSLIAEIEALKASLLEANSIIDAIREGDVDALVVNKEGKPHVYSLESADYTYRILIEKFGEGALSISDNGLVLYCNETFSKLIGLPANEITGTYFSTYVENPAEFEILVERLKNGPSKGELVLMNAGKAVHVYVTLTDLYPNVAAIGVVVTDLSEKRRHEEALLESSKRLESKVNELHLTNTNLAQFIHVISHDIKEPIRKILTYTSWLNDDRAILFPENELKKLNVINSSAVRLNSLVDDLVRYAFSAEKGDVISVDLNKIVKEVIDDLELVITENNAVVNFEQLPPILGSKVQLRQLLSNLMVNAIKYSDKNRKPEIFITSEVITETDNSGHGEKFYKIGISDNGIGMDSAHVNKIFTIFQRLHMREEYSGNGIGLAICKKIMENHDGKIEVESERNVGSVFYLYFPKKD